MSEYQQAERLCDLVMKGGITSGVVYPPAIDHIATKFWLNGIGGASAGAIAAAFAAAAEYSRRKGSDDGFRLLRDTPKQIGDGRRLMSLFKPDAETKSLHDLLIRAMKGKGRSWLVPYVAMRGAWLLATGSLKKFTRNGFGLCTGMGVGTESTRGPLPPLTQWLSDQIDRMAGMPPRSPLTFGHLWKAPVPDRFREALGTSPSIDLRMVTTCLTLGRPYTLPFLDRGYAFREIEFRRLFPGHVVDYMLGLAASIGPRAGQPRLPDGLYPFPVEDLMPVTVATRMSLSFPGLFTMVPLYRRNYHKGGGHERVWFSDGGITSNMPIHFFDSPVPRWPTLAINLQYADKDGNLARKTVDPDGIWMAEQTSPPMADLFAPFGDTGRPASDVGAFLMAIFRAAQTWHDNSLLRLPGYSGRVVEIWLKQDEGGMNLDMPAGVIDALVRKGGKAGERIVARFSDPASPDAMGWPEHRWARFRGMMPALAASLRSMRRGMTRPNPGDQSLLEFLKSGVETKGYQLGELQRADCVDAVDALLRSVHQFDRGQDDPPGPESEIHPFEGGPRPPLELAVRGQQTRMTGRSPAE